MILLFGLLNTVGVALKGTTAQAVAVALGSESLVIAELAVDVLVGSLTAADRVQALVARAAFEAFLVPSLSSSQHLFGLVYASTTARTALAFWGACNRAWLQHSAVSDLANPTGGRRFVGENGCWLVKHFGMTSFAGSVCALRVWIFLDIYLSSFSG